MTGGAPAAAAMKSLAHFGAKPRFARQVPCGQRHWPDWLAYRTIFDDIFDRQYYTNHGPLAQKLEARFAHDLGVRHAICVTNEYIALALCCQALRLSGPIVVPAHAPLRTVQPLNWASATPLFCDVDPQTGLLAAAQVEAVLAGQSACAILAHNPWCDACDVAGLEALAARAGAPLIFDSSQGFGCRIGQRPLGSLGSVDVISLQAEQIVSAGEGAIVGTNDDALAAHIRNIRSNYGMGPPVPVVKTGNGRLSEGQAALALYNLDRFAENLARNHVRRLRYADGLARIPGLKMRPSQGVTCTNAQNMVVLLDEEQFGISRDELVKLLRAENIDAGSGFAAAPGQMPCELYGQSLAEFPATRDWCARTLELPMHISFGDAEIDVLIETLDLIHRCAGDVRRKLAAVPA